MFELTIGYVAGIIAAAVTIVRLWSPNTLVYILSGLLGDSNTASTWSVAGRALQSSFWPELLQTDSARGRGVRLDVRFLVKSMQLMKLLIAIAGIITPLGLYSVASTGRELQPPFEYVKDLSSFGWATPPRSNMGLARSCASGVTIVSGPAPCPYTNDVVIETSYPNGTMNWEMPYNMSTALPNKLREIFGSGTVGFPSTIANYFDIEWRQYTKKTSKFYNNGTEFLVGTYRQMSSLILTDTVTPVEGLLVDAKVGGLGFRNHTIPAGVGKGGYWSEDLLYLQPETVCVNTNLTLDFRVPTISSNNTGSLSVATDVRLVDRGGFVNLNKTYPYYDHDNAQSNPDLQGRAYKAAWLNNAYTAAYMNVTNIANETSGEKAFRYLNSTLNKEFPLATQGGVFYESLSLSSIFGAYLGNSPGGVTKTGDSLYPNPWAITSDLFDSAMLVCRGAGNNDFANISNIMVACGLMRGAAIRKTPGPSVLFDAGSEWSVPLYTCASTVQATIKMTSFLLNGTGGLSDLSVIDVRQKEYPNNESIPLWAVEESGKRLTEIQPIWGLVSPAYEKYPNVSVVRQESLRLPGFTDSYGSLFASSTQNLPATDAPRAALISAYGINSVSGAGPRNDYTGYSNMAMYARWQNLSSNPLDAAKIVNLIWTDMAAPALVGTKSVLGTRNSLNNGGSDSSSQPLSITVRPLVNQVRYHWAFGIPAFLVLLLCIIIGAFAFLTFIFRRHGMTKMRKHLHQTAPGRILTAFLYPEYTSMEVPSRDWSNTVGRNVIDLGGDNAPMTLLAKNNFYKAGGVSMQEERMGGKEVANGEGDRFLGSGMASPLPSPYAGHVLGNGDQFVVPPRHQNGH